MQHVKHAASKGNLSDIAELCLIEMYVHIIFPMHFAPDWMGNPPDKHDSVPLVNEMWGFMQPNLVKCRGHVIRCIF